MIFFLWCRAAKEATGDFLLFIQDTVELLGPEQIQKMIEVFASAKGGTEEVGVVGNKVIEDDGTIYSAGIDFLLAKNPNKPASDPFSSWTQFQAYASSYSAGNSEVNRLIEGIYGRGRYQPNEASGGQDKTNSTDDSKDVLNAPEVPVIFHRMQGYNAHDSRVMSTQDVHAVSKGTFGFNAFVVQICTDFIISYSLYDGTTFSIYGSRRFCRELHCQLFRC